MRLESILLVIVLPALLSGCGGSTNRVLVARTPASANPINQLTSKATYPTAQAMLNTAIRNGLVCVSTDLSEGFPGYNVSGGVTLDCQLGEVNGSRTEVYFYLAPSHEFLVKALVQVRDLTSGQVSITGSDWYVRGVDSPAVRSLAD